MPGAPAAIRGSVPTPHAGPYARRAAAQALDEKRLQAYEEYVTVQLQLGAGGELAGEVADAVRDHPYREGLHHALMLALFRASRCLPPAAGDFTGRQEDLARTVGFGREGGGVRAVDGRAVDGMAGVGKTMLAVRAAHLLAGNYPDAQLFLDLHGHSEHRPVSPATALDRLLGLHPGEHFDDHATAALADLSLPGARKALEELLDRHLLEELPGGRFGSTTWCASTRTGWRSRPRQSLSVRRRSSASSTTTSTPPGRHRWSW